VEKMAGKSGKSGAPNVPKAGKGVGRKKIEEADTKRSNSTTITVHRDVKNALSECEGKSFDEKIAILIEKARIKKE
jgi:hypothetical protein